jgi:hypothetical protein
MAADSTRPKPSFFEQHRTVDEPPRRARRERDYERRSDERDPSGWADRGRDNYRPRESDTQSSDTDESTFFVENQPSRDTIKSLKPKGNNNSSSMRSPSPKKASSPNRPSQNFSDTYKGRGAMTMLNQIQNYTGSPAVRFDRWIKLFDNVVAMSNWNNAYIVNMLSTKMSGEAHDFLQNIMERVTQEYSSIKSLFQENFHGDEDSDYYQGKFDEIQRKPKENILNYAFHFKKMYQRLSFKQTRIGGRKSDSATFSPSEMFARPRAGATTYCTLQKVFYFEELVAVTQKYATKVQLDQHSKDQNVFVNAVAANDQKDSLIVQAIEKQNETIFAIVTSLKMGNKPSEANVYNNSAQNSNFDNRLDRLNGSIINLGGLMQANMETNNSLNQNSVGQSYQQNHQSSAPRNNFNKQWQNTRFQQPVGRETYLFDSQPSHYPNPNFPLLDFSLQPPVPQFPQPPPPRTFPQAIQQPPHQPNIQLQQVDHPFPPQIGSERRLCYSCRQRGHKIKDCPDRICM